uniref:Uncharacterized protein n=1 Tax=Favella ehrenbergii TaxID=182087 RepID=A0A7S3HVL8_9SPIT
MLGVDQLVHLTNKLVQVDALTRNLCHAVLRPKQTRRAQLLLILEAPNAATHKLVEDAGRVAIGGVACSSSFGVDSHHEVHATVEHHVIVFSSKPILFFLLDLVVVALIFIDVHERVQSQFLLFR